MPGSAGAALLAALTLVSLAAAPAAAQDPWWDSNWANRKKITFDNSASAENLIDFPALIRLTAADIDTSRTQNQGQDIRFVDAGGTPVALDYEIERWDEAGESVVWVRVPQIDAGSTTDYIWLYYNNPSASDGQNAAGVWSNGYAGVWHLEEAGGTRADATANGNDLGDVNTVTSASGQIDVAAQYANPNEEKLTISDAAQTGLDPTGNVTWMTWVRPDTSGVTQSAIDKENASDTGYRLRLNGGGGGHYNCTVWDGGNLEQGGRGNTKLTEGVWAHLTCVYDGTAIKTYHNGMLENSYAYSGGIIDSPTDFQLGARGTGQYMHGLLDEARVSGVARSDDWIEAVYRFTDPGTSVISFGSEESGGGGSATLLGRYWFNEAASGQGPDTVFDDQANPVDLAITYDTPVEWTVDNGHRGLGATSGTHAGLVTANVAGTKYPTNLDGATRASFVTVAEWGTNASTQRIIGFMDGDTRIATFATQGDGDLELWVRTQADIYNIRWSGGGWADGVRRVFHFVYDADDPTADRRVRLYVDGVDQGAGTTVGGTWPAQGEALNLGGAGVNLTGLNRPGDLARPLNGTVFYYGVYTGELTDSEISSDASALLSDDDNQTYSVSVTPDGLASPTLRPAGTGYTRDFTVTNSSAVSEDFDLLARTEPTSSFLTIDSITFNGLSFVTPPDSARLAGLAAGAADTATVWYSVASSTDGRVDTLYLQARSVSDPATLDDGFAEVEFDAPCNGAGAGGGNGIIQVDAVSCGKGDGVSSLTISHTTSGSDRLMLVGASVNPDLNETVTSVTYDGVALDTVGTVQEQDDARVEIWKLVAPPTGTHDVVITFSATLDRNAVAGVVTFTGVDQTTPVGPFAAAQGDNAGPATVDVTSASDELVFGVAALEVGGPLTAGPGQTERWNDSIPSPGSGPTTFGAGSTEPGAPTVTTSWTFPNADKWAVAGVSIKPASAGPLSLSSATDQTFVVGDPATTAATLTITDDASSPTITAANDLRIRIPPGFNMVWDTTVTSVTLGGSAAGKVSATVAGYEDADQTVVLDVTGDFAAGEGVTVDNLAFTTFSAASAADSLELEVANDGAVSATDDKTVEIVAESLGVSVTPDGLASPTLRQAGTAYSRDFTITNTGNGVEDFDLLARTEPTSSFLSIDSITVNGLSFLTPPDSARLSGLAAGASDTATLWYSVASSTDGRVDTLYLQARSVTDPGTLDDGFAEVEFDAAACSGTTFQKGDGKGATSETDDAELREGSPDTNLSTATSLSVDASSHRHLVLKFPNLFGAGPDQIPPGSTVNCAILTLEVIDVTDIDPTLYQATESWVESEVTWNSRSSGVSWTNPGADGTGSHKTAAEGNFPMTATGFQSMDVTTSVQNWSDGEANEGWVFVDNSSNGADFNSSEHATVASRPQLTVDYTPAAPAAPTLSSAANQTFVVGDPATNAATITITDDASSPTITAANDLRIRIPAGFNMVWDTTVTSVTLGGSAASKVSTTLSPYEDTDMTVVLEVISDFAASDTLTVDGLRFTDFSAASTADNLELEVANDGAVSATDDKTIEIVTETLGVAVTPDGLASPVQRLEGTAYSRGLTVTNTGNGVEDFDLLARAEPASSFLTIDSISGTNVSQGAQPDSARLTGLAASGSAGVTVWYTVAGSTDGRVDTLYLTARSVSDSGVSDDGFAEVEFADPPSTSTCTANVMMIVGNAASPDASDQAIATFLGNNGLTVFYADDDDTTTDYENTISANGIVSVYISESVGSSRLGTKAQNLSVGVVTANDGSWEDALLGGSSGAGLRTTVNLIDNSHYITSGFSTDGFLAAYSSDGSVAYAASPGAGATVLAESPSASGRKTLLVYETGSPLADGSSAPARRAGIYSDDVYSLWTDNTRTLVLRTIMWAGGLDASCGITYDVSVTPDGLGSPVQRQAGADYTQDFTVTNNSSVSEDFDLLGRAAPTPSFLTIDSISGSSVSQGAQPDSARITGLGAGASATVSVWYSVAAAMHGRVDTLFLRARSVSDTATSDEGFAEVQAQAAPATLVGRYWLNEAGSGQGPDTIFDDQANPLNLPVTYTASMAWTEPTADHRGLENTSATNTGGAFATADGTKYETTLEGAARSSFATVVRYEDTGNTQRFAGFPHAASLQTGSNGVFEFRFRTTAQSSSDAAIRWSIFSDDVRRVYHVVYDAQHDTAERRIRLYVDGVDQGAGTLNSGSWPAQGEGLTFAFNNLELIMMNRSDGTRPMDGALHYYAVYDGMLTDSEISTDATALAADDDNVGFAVSVTPDGVDTLSHLPGSGYSHKFTVTNNGAVFDDFDLLGFPGVTAATFLSVDSITGSSVTQGAQPDSARLSGVAPGASDSAFVWFTVADTSNGTLDSLYLEGRSVSDVSVADSGHVFVRLAKPNITTARSVSPGGTQAPGTDLTYTITLTNDGGDDAVGVVLVDSLGAEVDFKVGTVVNSLPAAIGVNVEYSDDDGATWTYTPASGACGALTGYDACVTRIRWTLQDNLPAAAPDNSGDVEYVARIQ